MGFPILDLTLGCDLGLSWAWTRVLGLSTQLRLGLDWVLNLDSGLPASDFGPVICMSNPRDRRYYTWIAVIYSSSVLRCLWEGMREAGDEWPNCSVKGKKMS